MPDLTYLTRRDLPAPPAAIDGPDVAPYRLGALPEANLTANLTANPPAADPATPANALTVHRCGNCEAVLSGPYCAQCGQHAHASARDLAAVVHDAWHDLTHVDGRLWRTLWLLLVRPGRLTAEYFRERRASYMPPVRLYLVVSLVFFAFSVGAGSHPKPKAAGPAAAAAPAAKPSGDAGIAALSAPSTPAATALTPAPAAPTGPGAPKADKDEDDDPDPDVEHPLKSGTDELITNLRCEHVQSFSPALTRSLTAACRNIVDEGTDAFLRTLVHNVPKMMFVFLPMMAAVMLLLYWWPRRYYVEHLVLLLHNHSALFLSFVLLNVIAFVAHHLPALHFALPLGGIALFFYVLWYPYASMRRYYAQGRLLTLSKYSIVASAYLICLLFVLLGTGVVTALLAE